MRTASISVPRLIRIATLLFAALAGTLVFLAYAPSVEALQQRLADDTSTLRSDETVVHAMPQLRAEQRLLARRYDSLFAQNAEATLLRDLGTAASRHGATLISTSVSHGADSKQDEPKSKLFVQTHLNVSMRGRYAQLLAAIGDISTGSEIVRVDAPSMRRDSDRVLAIVPVTMFEPIRRSAEPITEALSAGVPR